MYIKLKALYVFFKYTDTKINDIIQYIMSELLRMTGISKSFGQVKTLDNDICCNSKQKIYENYLTNINTYVYTLTVGGYYVCYKGIYKREQPGCKNPKRISY